MNPTLALFWKEGREAAYKVVACAGLAMIVGLVFSQWEFAPADVNVVSHAVGLFGAVLMGMDAIARERSRMTLPFLCCVGRMASVEDSGDKVHRWRRRTSGDPGFLLGRRIYRYGNRWKFH